MDYSSAQAGRVAALAESRWANLIWNWIFFSTLLALGSPSLLCEYRSYTVYVALCQIFKLAWCDYLAPRNSFSLWGHFGIKHLIGLHYAHWPKNIFSFFLYTIISERLAVTERIHCHKCPLKMQNSMFFLSSCSYKKWLHFNLPVRTQCDKGWCV